MKFKIGDRVHVKRPEKDDPMESELGWTEEMDARVGDYQKIIERFPVDGYYPVGHYRLEDGFYYAENWLGREGE